MGKKIIFIFILFSIMLFNLHQRIQIYVEAYRLNENYKVYRHLVDIRDHLLYNFCQRAPLDKINSWAENNGFVLKHQAVRVALNIEVSPKNNNIVSNKRRRGSLVQKLLEVSGVMAEEQH